MSPVVNVAAASAPLRTSSSIASSKARSSSARTYPQKEYLKVGLNPLQKHHPKVGLQFTLIHQLPRVSILRSSGLRLSKKFPRGELEPTAAETPAERLTPPSEGRQDVLGATVLAFREPLAQLRDDRTRHTVALEPSKQLLLAGGELHPLQVPTHLGGQALPQEIHGPLPPPLLGRLAG